MSRSIKVLSQFGLILTIGFLFSASAAVAASGECSVVDAGTYISTLNYTSAGSNFTDSGPFLEAENKDRSLPVPSDETPLGYEVYFPAAGPYYVYVLGNSNDSSNSDSIWYGLDGVPTGGIDTPDSDSDFHWSNARQTEGPDPAAITVSSPGVHTINFWSREEGFEFKAFYLSTSDSGVSGTPTYVDPTDAAGICSLPVDLTDPTFDHDGDGFTEAGFPTDCKPFDADIYPADPNVAGDTGAPEICNNVEDDNCNGQIDEGCATVTIVDGGPLSQIPLTLVNPAKPQVMLNMSNDHQLFMPAFKEYDDLDGINGPDRTYLHSVKYYGYFDSDKCYDYVNNRFEPESLTTDRYCNGNWSGNFLNWASMARIDVVRKILYGGYRSIDTATETELERSYIPSDMHSWVKHYRGSDLDRLTPFNVTTSEPIANSSTSVTIGIGSHTFSHDFAASEVRIGDQVRVEANADSDDKWMEGVVTAVGVNVTIDVHAVSGNGATYDSWEMVNLTRQGISICNTTHATSGFSQDVALTEPPLMRVAFGDYGLWTANENVQCRWDEETAKDNNNIKALTGMTASKKSPKKNEVGLDNSGNAGTGGGDYVVRLVVCDSANDLLGVEKCRPYPNGNYKPVGLLQIHGENDSLDFGLMTGSYEKNKSGGVLRKNIGTIKDEIDQNNGTFLSAPAAGSIITSLDLLRVFGYKHDGLTYSDSSSNGDNCTFDKDRDGDGVYVDKKDGDWNDGQCTNWGNPQSEIFLESLRYFAGQTETSDFAISGDDKITDLKAADWADPLSTDEYCTSLNVINFNASIASFDNDQLDGVTDLNTGSSATELTDIVGAGESIHGENWFVGENGSVAANDSSYQICTSKTIDSLGAVEGTCPEAPKSEGSFQIAGLAHYAFTNDIRDDLTDDQNVKTYGVALAAAVPKIVVDLPTAADPDRKVTILPACRDHRMEPAGSCAIVNFKVIEQTNDAGSFYVQWEASASGGDYDQDMGGILNYRVNLGADTITVQTLVIAESAGMISPFGYTISGTSKDGFHAHSGLNNYDFTDPTGVLGCNDCDLGDAPTSVTYDITGDSGSLLESPLYYAAKWGGYDKENTTLTFPTDQDSWDSDGDGIPDNYFFANNPEKLESDLKEVLNSLAEVSSSSAAVASNSTQLQTGTTIYQAKFNSVDWSGEFLGISLDTDEITGEVVAETLWEAEEEFPAPADRNIYSYDPATSAGVEFLWEGAVADAPSFGLTVTQKTALNKPLIGAAADDLGDERVAFFRGDSSVERQNGGEMRDREAQDVNADDTKILADIVNSDPIFVGVPNYGYSKLIGDEGTSYTSFRAALGDESNGRAHMVYVGSNGGMLHGFDAVTGEEHFAYVPNTIIEHLPRITLTNYGTTQNGHRYLVDGAPKAGDAYLSDGWHTLLLGTTGAGGSAIFALDVTDPENFSSDDVMWEVNHTTVDGNGDLAYVDLGYTIAQPTIGRVNVGAGGKWVAFMSNGYHSEELNGTGKAILYVIDLETGLPLLNDDGDVVGILDVEEDSIVVDGTTFYNGLSTPVPVDSNGDRTVDYVYAGDLLGNMWKFDFTSNDTADWGSAYRETAAPKPPLPLFTARGTNGELQPITVRPAVGRHPNGTDIMVWFGTGKFFDSNDRYLNPTPDDRAVMSFYGIVDTGSEISTTDRSQLQGQTIIFEGEVTIIDDDGATVELFDGRAVRAISQNSVDYNVKEGWFMDLVSPNSPYKEGERVIEQAILNEGKIVFVTLIPSSSPCEPGGTSWLMEVEPFSGGRLATTIYDADGDGDIDDDDKITLNDGTVVTVTGIESEEGIIQAPKILDDDSDVNSDGTSTQQKVFSGSTGNLMFQEEKGGDLTNKGRHSWRQIK